VAKKIKELTTIPGLGSLFDVKNIPVIGAYLSGFQQIGQNARERNNSQFNTVARPSVGEISTQLKLLKAKKDELALLNKKNAIENKNVEELKKKFDVERVGLFSALGSAQSEEEKLRIRSLIAIKDNDAALAGKIQAELNAAKATDYLSSALFRLSAEFDMERTRMALGRAQVAAATPMGGISPIASSQAALDTALKLYPDFGTEMDAARSAAARGGVTVNINNAGSVTTDRDLVSMVTNAIYNNQASGIPINYSTSYV